MTSQLPRATRIAIEAFAIVRVGTSGDAVAAAGDELVFRTRDLSMTGLFLYTRVARAYPLRVGSTLDLEFYDDSASFRCTVVIARVVETGSAEADRFPTGFGVHIVACDDANRATIQRLCAADA